MASKNETRQHILQTAVSLFQSQGYARTTTQAIAAEAGVAEVTLFRHFGSKEKLFQAVVGQVGGTAVLTQIENQLSGDYHADLLFVTKHILQILTAQRETIRLMMFEASHFPEVQVAVTKNPRELRQLLSRYFQQQIDRGLVRPLDPEIMAQSLFGTLFGYAVGLDEPLSVDISLDEIAAQFVDIFVEGTAV